MGTRTHSVALKLIDGIRPDQVNTDAPVPPEAPFPEPPPWFQPAAMNHYFETVRRLTELGLANEVDVDLVISYVMCVQIVRQCEQQMSLRGNASRVYTRWEKTCRRMHALARELGLAPAARTSLRVKAVKPDDNESNANKTMFG